MNLEQSLTREDVEKIKAAADAAGDEYTNRICAILLCRTHKTTDEEFFSSRHDPAVVASGQWIARIAGKKLCASL